MAVSNRELVERAYEAQNAGDDEAFVAFLDPEIEWHWPRGMAETDVFRGHEGVWRGLDAWREAWADFRLDPLEVFERGDEVFVVVRYDARGRESGLEVEQVIAHLWELRDGKAIRWRMFGDAEKARRRFLEG